MSGPSRVHRHDHSEFNDGGLDGISSAPEKLGPQAGWIEMAVEAGAPAIALIRVEVAPSGMVSILLYDAQGQRVESLRMSSLAPFDPEPNVLTEDRWAAICMETITT